MPTIIIIQARMDSKRLPGKVVMKIQGKTILEHIVNFSKFSKLADKIIIATTSLPEDDKIANLSTKLGIDCYRGNPNDVLERYYECAKLFKGDLIIRLTGDNPLIDPALVDEVIQICKETGCDYASNMIHQTYPLGYLVEAITFDTLKKINFTQKDPLSREHVTYHVRQNPQMYNIEEVFAPSELARPHWRLTIDNIEDFHLISEIFSRLYEPSSVIEYRRVVDLLDENKDLLKINKKYH